MNEERLDGKLLNLTVPNRLPERRCTITVSAEDGGVKVWYYSAGDLGKDPFIYMSGNSAQDVSVWLDEGDEQSGVIASFSSSNLEGGPIFDEENIKRLLEEALEILTKAV